MTCKYTEHIGKEHRRDYGQFFTHPSIAKFMTEWVMESGLDSIFDPAFGLGVFYEQLSDDSKPSFSAMEIDLEILKYWKNLTGHNTDFITNNDYLKAWGLQHSNIVCNPPYMKFQKFLNRDKVFSDFQKQLGVKLSGYTNTASAFLIKSLSELKKGGRLAYIMPLEFLNAGYGTIVKEMLLKDRHLYAVLSLECEKDIFPDATTSVGILLFDSSQSFDRIKFYSLNRISEVEAFSQNQPVSEINHKEIKADEKWLPFFSCENIEVDKENANTLDFYGRFGRGIATGANEFFVLTRTDIGNLGLDESLDCIACISKSSQIKTAFFSDDEMKCLIETDQPVYLFSVNGNLRQGAQRYIEVGEEKSYHQRYLTKNRTPWYKTEKRDPAPLLLGVFSRGRYKIIRNTTNAINLTCYHGFQPNLFGSNYIDHIFLFLSSSTGRKLASLVSRKYGDALDKFEPNDINKAVVPTPEFFNMIPQEKIQEALKEFKESNMIPSWLERKFGEILIPNKAVEATP